MVKVIGRLVAVCSITLMLAGCRVQARIYYEHNGLETALVTYQVEMR